MSGVDDEVTRAFEVLAAALSQSPLSAAGHLAARRRHGQQLCLGDHDHPWVEQGNPCPYCRARR